MEEYERTLSVLTTRIEESDALEICLISNLHQLLGILNELRGHFEGIAEESERDIDSLYKGLIRFHFCMQSILIKLHKLLKHFTLSISTNLHKKRVKRNMTETTSYRNWNALKRETGTYCKIWEREVIAAENVQYSRPLNSWWTCYKVKWNTSGFLRQE